jgi:hypothetical protein
VIVDADITDVPCDLHIIRSFCGSFSFPLYHIPGKKQH